MATKPGRKEKAARVDRRRHFSMTIGGLEDLEAVAAQMRTENLSYCVCSALRCFRASLAAGLVAESGELIKIRDK